MAFSYTEADFDRRNDLYAIHPDLVEFTYAPRYDRNSTFEDRGECPSYLGVQYAAVFWMRPRTQEQQAELFAAIRFDPKTARDVRQVMCANPAQVGLSWFQPA